MRSNTRLRLLPVLVAGLLCCAQGSADVLRKVDTQGKVATSGIMIGNTFYFAGHDLPPLKARPQEEESPRGPGYSIAGLFSPGSSKKSVVGDTGRIYALERFDRFLLAAAEKGLFKTDINEDSSLGEGWNLISAQPSDTLAVVSNLICVGTGRPLIRDGAKAGYGCYDLDGTPTGPRDDKSPTALQSFGEYLLVGGNGFLKIHRPDGKVVSNHTLTVNPGGGALLSIGGIIGVGSSAWVWTTQPSGFPGPLFRVRIEQGTVGGLETFLESTLEDKDVTMVSDVNSKPWFGTWKGEILRLMGDQEVVPLDMEGITSLKAISGIRQLLSGSIWIGTTDGSFILGQSLAPDGTVRLSPKPLLAMKKENEKIDVHLIEEGKTLWLWGNSGVYEFDSSLSLSFETNSYTFLGWLGWLLDAPLRVVWGSDLKVDFDKAFYYRNGAKEEGTRFAALPLEVTSDPRAIELARADRSTSDDYAWAKIRHFDHDLISFWPRKVDLIMKDSFGNLSQTQTQRYLPILTAIQLIPIYFLLSALGNLFFLWCANRDLARRFFLRDSGKLIVFNRNWVLFQWTRRRLLVHYRSRLREHLDSQKRSETIAIDASLVAGLRKKQATLAHSAAPSRLWAAARSYRLHLLDDDTQDVPLMTPVEVNLQTAVKNEIAFHESAKMELHEFGSFYHSGIREQILNDPDMVFCITGITSGHLKKPETNCESGNSRVYWALKHLFETYGTSHGILIFCQGKPECYDSLGTSLSLFALDSQTCS